ncbi:Protein NNT-1, related [Eimeria necatrix]|uniref:proton-translocating NAD(P)(+) transhydrogenase n=1 Tax=Eimeria necatrix TaxID=51315 RepID=U6MTY4_9EIME|nr:Protein NNT-1, related [Eimeria necatrix]CDJ65120.1 Protein NNT-1, related [Eimeria necatrix]
MSVSSASSSLSNRPPSRRLSLHVQELKQQKQQQQGRNAPELQQQHKKQQGEQQQQREQQQEQQEQENAAPATSWNLTDASAAAATLLNARCVLVVPGWGLAQSRCGAEFAETVKLLLLGSCVEIGVSPIAGLFPGHISLFLQGVPERLIKTGGEVVEMLFKYDACLIVGANDVVNPTLTQDGKSLKGAIIEAWRVPRVVALRRSQGPRGPLGGKNNNPTFLRPNVCVLPGDAKKSLAAINEALRHLGRGVGEGRGWPPIRVYGDLDEDPTAQPVSHWPPPVLTVGALRDQVGGGIVPLDPRGVQRLRAMGFRVLVERDLGEEAATVPTAEATSGALTASGGPGGPGGPCTYSSLEYTMAGADVCDLEEVLRAEVLVHPTIPPLDYFMKAGGPANGRAANAAAAAAGGGKGSVLICSIPPGRPCPLLPALSAARWSVLSLSVSSPSLQARGVAAAASLEALRGSKALLQCLYALPRLVKGLTTAAGRIDPAMVLVLGAGVEGLHAAAAAYKSGAKVYVADPRISAKAAVESIGAVFLSVLLRVSSWEALSRFPQVVGTLRALVQKSDIVVCAPRGLDGGPPGEFEGGPPQLVPEEWMEGMKAGAVVIDMLGGHPDAAPGWFGCVQRSPQGEPLETGPLSPGIMQGPPVGVTVLDGSSLQQLMPKETSRILSESVCNLLQQLKSPEALSLSLPDETDPVLHSLLLLDRGDPLPPKAHSIFRGRRTLSQLKLGSSISGHSRQSSVSSDAASAFFQKS